MAYSPRQKAAAAAVRSSRFPSANSFFKAPSTVRNRTGAPAISAGSRKEISRFNPSALRARARTYTTSAAMTGSAERRENAVSGIFRTDLTRSAASAASATVFRAGCACFTCLFLGGGRCFDMGRSLLYVRPNRGSKKHFILSFHIFKFLSTISCVSHKFPTNFFSTFAGPGQESEKIFLFFATCPRFCRIVG